jgi:YgiT-type zinc finger domain-containing protein
MNMRSSATKTTKIRCSKCGKGKLRHKTVDYDVGHLVDMKRVFVEGLPALVCPNCGAVSVEGKILETVTFLVAAEILERPELAPLEVRYLRKLLGDTQDEFAARLGVVRATVNRWENSEANVTGPDAYAIRSHTFFRLQDNPIVDAVAPAFTSEKARTKSKPKRSYKLQGADVISAL